MVRGAPAVLIGSRLRVLPLVFAAALAFFLLAEVLPGPSGTGDANTVASDVPGLLLLGACALAMLPLRDSPGTLLLLTVGTGLIAGGMLEAGSLGAANIPKVAFASALGMLLAYLLASPSVVIAVPLFVAGIDVLSVAGGPTEAIVSREGGGTDFLSFYMPAVSEPGRAGVFGIADLIFFAFFAASAWRFGLRRRATAICLMVSLPLLVTALLFTERAIPGLPLLAAALLLPNLDLLPGLLRSEQEDALESAPAG